MKKKIILHIGANKTGSSAIQRFISLNRKEFLDEGIVIPNDDFQVSDSIQGYHVWGFARLIKEEANGQQILEDAVEDIFRSQPSANTILFSAENLTANAGAPHLFQNIAKKYEIRVIVYIRRQDDFILSSWQQWHSKRYDDFWAWTISVLGTLGNWRTHLQNWETVVDRSQITVRVYERPKLKDQDVMSDFHQWVGLERPLSALNIPTVQVNPSFSDSIVDLVKGNDLIFENTHDNEFYRFIEKYTGDLYFRKSAESILTVEQRRAIIKTYQKSNNWVKRNYFPGADGELFSEIKDNDFTYVDSDKMTKQQLQFLTTLIYRLHGEKGKVK